MECIWLKHKLVKIISLSKMEVEADEKNLSIFSRQCSLFFSDLCLVSRNCAAAPLEE